MEDLFNELHDFLDDTFNEVINFNDYRYFYHITGHGIGQKIIENGLLMAEKEYYTTMIEITPDMISDPQKFLQDEKGFGQMQRDEMVIVRIPKSKGYDFTVSLGKGNLEIFESQDDIYIVPNDYILGYFDLETEEFTFNEYVKGEEDYSYMV